MKDKIVRIREILLSDKADSEKLSEIKAELIITRVQFSLKAVEERRSLIEGGVYIVE